MFTVLYLGYIPRITLERFDSGEQRIQKVCDLIQVSKFSIHDLSRMRAKRKSEIYRMNMPFELGIDIGCRLFKEGETRRKICLVLEKKSYEYQRALSDLSGVDVRPHGNEPERIIREVRNWFVTNELGTSSSAAKIWEDFNEFMADFYQQRGENGFKDTDLEMMPVPEYVTFAKEWLARRARYQSSKRAR
ncbi:hypothetical protein ACFLV0_02940 [Chloroflexota bacterium]